jgi:quercetin 2,3-dioxygenase
MMRCETTLRALSPTMNKSIDRILRTQSQHWVGDGFPVRTLLFYGEQGESISPFLLLDYAGPAQFPPTEKRLGVGEHPHRGFETVTIVYDGEVEHRDSSGASGTIGAGDVQWMTAASGVVHEEFHGCNFAKSGGRFEMVQLWVNLPAVHKMDAPRYQEITSAHIPVVSLPNDAGSVRVIAGAFADTQGAAKTFSPVNVWDVRLNGHTTFEIPAGYTAAVAVLEGAVDIGDGTTVSPGEIALMGKTGTQISLTSTANAKLLVLGGQPLNEPIAGHGPFVMNTRAELVQAFQDYQAGKLGALSA